MLLLMHFADVIAELLDAPTMSRILKFGVILVNACDVRTRLNCIPLVQTFKFVLVVHVTLDILSI